MSAPQLVTLSYSPDGTKQVLVTFDASINEQHGGQAQATEHPVESGPSVTDNVRPMPKRLTIEVMATNTPIDTAVLAPSTAAAGSFSSGEGNGLQFSEQFDRVQDVVGALFDAQANGALCSVVTSLTSYENMAIINLAIPRNAESGNAVRITVDMQEVILVEVATVAALSARHQLTNRGTKPAKPVAPVAKEEQARSLLKGLVGMISGGGK